MNLNNWTISRRIISSFIVLLLILLALGGFCIWQVDDLRSDIEGLADNSLPSVLVLGQCDSLRRDVMIKMSSYLATTNAETREGIGKQIEALRVRVDESLAKYATLLADEHERQSFEEIKRTHAAFVTTRHQLMELVRLGKSAEDVNHFYMADLFPRFDVAEKALEDAIDYNNKLGMEFGNAGKANALTGVRLIAFILTIAIFMTALLAFVVVRSIKKSLENITENLDQGSLNTASTSQQVANASQTLSSGASQQASSVEETSASLEEMSSMIQATAENAQKAKSLAAEARTVAENGSRTMVEMVAAMAEIDSTSAQVAKIVKNIDEIAFQTNILALNAAVEAARAGEAGAGFAVVADEVRSLAQRSAAAAKETADKIEAAIASSRKGSQCTSRVGESLTQISEKVTATDLLVSDIATAANEQAQGIEQINQAVGQMDKVCQSNASSAMEIASAAEQMDARAKIMKEQVLKLRQLVGDQSVSNPGESNYRVNVVTPPATSERFRRPVNIVNNRSRPKAIPMPEDQDSKDTGSASQSSDSITSRKDFNATSAKL